MTEKKSNVVRFMERKNKVLGNIGNLRTRRSIAKRMEDMKAVDVSHLTRDSKGHVLVSEEEEAFVQYISTGFSRQKAYILAFGEDPNLPHQIARHKSQTVLGKTRVSERLREVLAEQAQYALAEGERLKSFIRARLEDEAENAMESGARLRALELLGKLPDVQIFSDKVQHTVVNGSSAAIEEEIRKKLARLLPAPQKPS